MNPTTDYQEKYVLLFQIAQCASHVYELPEWKKTFTAFVELFSKRPSEDITMVEVVPRFSRLYPIPEPMRPLLEGLEELCRLPAQRFFAVFDDISRLFKRFLEDFIHWEQEYKDAERLTPQIVSYWVHGLQFSDEQIDNYIRCGFLNPDFPNCLKLFKRYLWGLELMTRLGISDYYLVLWLLYDSSALQQPFVFQSIEQIKRRPVSDKHAKKLKRLLARVISDADFGGPRPKTATDEWIFKRVNTLSQQEKNISKAIEQVYEEMLKSGEKNAKGKDITYESVRKRYYRYRKKKL